MSDPLPPEAPASGYNTTPRPRSRKKFKLFAPPKEPEGFYSPFWPLLVIFLAFVVLLLYEISALRARSMAMHMQISRLQDAEQKASAQVAFIQGLHADLVKIAPLHPIAGNLLKEFFPPIPAAESGDASKTPSPADATNAAPANAPASPPANAPKP